MREGRVAQRLAALDLLAEEGGRVVTTGVDDAGRGRRQGLDDHLAAGGAATAATGELGDHREGPLGGAEVGEAQGGVGVEDRAQRHLGEVVPLGDHLGADEDGALGLAEGGEDAGMGATAAGRVGVEAEDRHRRQPLGQQRLDLLGADAGARERGRVAIAAGARQRLGMGAVMADEAAAVAVDDQRDVAVGTVPVTPAGPAGEPGREAAPVDHHDRLRPGLADAAERLPGGGMQRAGAGIGLAHVEHPHRRHRAAVDAVGQLQRGSSSHDSGRGVAVPATSTAPHSAARRRATVRAS